MAPTSPTVALREFSYRVRTRRRELGITAQTMCHELGFSRVYYSSVENARTILSDAKLPTLAALLQLSAEETETLAKLLADSRTRGWWHSKAKVLEPAFVEFLGLEHGASRMRIYEARAMTGLLQTREYAKEVIGASPEVSLANLETTLDVRMYRQRRLYGESPPLVELVLSETVLLQQYGDATVLLAQLELLLSQAEDPSLPIHVQVQPFSKTPLGMTGAATVVLFYFDTALPPIGWQESAYPNAIAEDPEAVQAMELNFRQIQDSCADQDESMDLIRGHIARLRGTNA